MVYNTRVKKSFGNDRAPVLSGTCRYIHALYTQLPSLSSLMVDRGLKADYGRVIIVGLAGSLISVDVTRIGLER